MFNFSKFEPDLMKLLEPMANSLLWALPLGWGHWSQAGHVVGVRGHRRCGGPRPSHQKHGCAGFGAAGACWDLIGQAFIVVHLRVEQRIRGDDPGGWAQSLQGVWRLHAAFDLLTRPILTIL